MPRAPLVKNYTASFFIEHSPAADKGGHAEAVGCQLPLPSRQDVMGHGPRDSGSVKQVGHRLVGCWCRFLVFTDIVGTHGH